MPSPSRCQSADLDRPSPVFTIGQCIHFIDHGHSDSVCLWCQLASLTMADPSYPEATRWKTVPVEASEGYYLKPTPRCLPSVCLWGSADRGPPSKLSSFFKKMPSGRLVEVRLARSSAGRKVRAHQVGLDLWPSAFVPRSHPAESRSCSEDKAALQSITEGRARRPLFGRRL